MCCTAGGRGASGKSESAAAPKAKTVGRDNDSGTTRAAGQVLFLPTGTRVGASNAVEVVRRGAAIQAARDALQVISVEAAQGSGFRWAVVSWVLVSLLEK